MDQEFESGFPEWLRVLTWISSVSPGIYYLKACPWWNISSQDGPCISTKAGALVPCYLCLCLCTCVCANVHACICSAGDEKIGSCVFYESVAPLNYPQLPRGFWSVFTTWQLASSRVRIWEWEGEATISLWPTLQRQYCCWNILLVT